MAGSILLRAIFEATFFSFIRVFDSGVVMTTTSMVVGLRLPNLPFFTTLEIVRTLVKHGAQWRPRAQLRSGGHLCEPDVTLEQVNQLLMHSASTHETSRPAHRTLLHLAQLELNRL